MKVRTGLFIDGKGEEQGRRVVVDVGFLAMHYPEIPCLGPLMNAVGQRLRSIASANCKFVVSDTSKHLVWVQTTHPVRTGMHSHC